MNNDEEEKKDDDGPTISNQQDQEKKRLDTSGDGINLDKDEDDQQMSVGFAQSPDDFVNEMATAGINQDDGDVDAVASYSSGGASSHDERLKNEA